MNQKELLLRQLEFAYEKEDWCLPLATALEGVTAEQASWRPVGEASNTIWETVNHLLYYKERLVERLRGEEPNNWAKSNDETFEGKGATGDEEAWQTTVQHMLKVHKELQAIMERMSVEEFDQPIPTTSGQRISSIITHDFFHTGQIVLIRKLQGSWPARRSFE